MEIYEKGVQLNYKNSMEDQTTCSTQVIIDMNDWDMYIRMSNRQILKRYKEKK